MIDIAKTEEQIANNLQAFNQYVDNIRLVEFQLETTDNPLIAKGMKKQLATYKRMAKNHLLQAQSLTQQVKSYEEAK